MSDNQQEKNTIPPTPAPAEDNTAASSSSSSSSSAPAAASSSSSPMIPKERFDQVNAKRKAAEEQQAAAAEELAKLSGRLSELEQTLAAERRQRQALEIATAAGIGDWAGDLRGNTAEELTEHAAQIKARLETYARSSTAGTPAPMGGRPAPAVDLEKLNDPNWVAKNPKKALQMELQRQRQNGSG